MKRVDNPCHIPLDLRGLKCPLPALHVRKALRGLRGDQVLVVRATDPMSAIDIPHAATQAGWQVTHCDRSADELVFTIASLSA